MTEYQQKLSQIESALKGARRVSRSFRYGGLVSLDNEIAVAQDAVKRVKEYTSTKQLKMEGMEAR